MHGASGSETAGRWKVGGMTERELTAERGTASAAGGCHGAAGAILLTASLGHIRLKCTGD